MNKALINESFRKLNEAEELEKDYRQARNKVYDFLEQFYERKVQEFLVDEGVTAMEVKAAVPGYNPDWCPDEYTEQVAAIDQQCVEELIAALVKADMKTLFLNVE